MVDAYQTLGARMVEFDVSVADLEAKIGELGTKVSNENVRSLVTGYIDAVLEGRAPWRSGIGAYLLIHGMGRFLYNGNFEEVRKKSLEMIAARSMGSFDDIHKTLSKRQDIEGINRIAELVLDTMPKITYTWFKGSERPAILKRIVEKYENDEKYKEMVAGCLSELKDFEKLRALARKYVTKDLDFATGLLGRDAVDDDWRFIARQLKDSKPLIAYEIIWRIKDKKDDDKKFLSELEEWLIANDIENAFNYFERVQYNDADRKRFNVHQNALIKIGRRFLEMNLPIRALEAFAKTNCDENSPEYREAGMQLWNSENLDELKDIIYEHSRSYPLSSATRHAVKHALQLTAADYFTKGGDPEISNDYIRPDCGDDLNRKLGNALAKLPRNEADKYGDWRARTSYARILRVQKKTKDDERLLATLRERIIQAQHLTALNVFHDAEDVEGMRLYAERFKDDPMDVYRAGWKLQDNEMIAEARKRLLGSKWSLSSVLSKFESYKDDEGIKIVKEALAPGVPTETANVLLSKKKGH